MISCNGLADMAQTNNGAIKMKSYYLLILIIGATLLTLPACDNKQTGSEKVMNKVDDALDRRPGEKIRDAAEDAGHELDDAAKAIKESAKDAGR